VDHENLKRDVKLNSAGPLAISDPFRLQLMTTSPLIVEITDRSGERAVSVLRPSIKFVDNDRFKRAIFSSADRDNDNLLS
jgi:hypothetical protein